VWWVCGFFYRGVNSGFTGIRVAEAGDSLIELGVGQIVDVVDVPVVGEDAINYADNWFVSGWYAGVRVVVVVVISLPLLSDHLVLYPAVKYLVKCLGRVYLVIPCGSRW